MNNYDRNNRFCRKNKRQTFLQNSQAGRKFRTRKRSYLLNSTIVTHGTLLGIRLLLHTARGWGFDYRCSRHSAGDSIIVSYGMEQEIQVSCTWQKNGHTANTGHPGSIDFYREQLVNP